MTYYLRSTEGQAKMATTSGMSAVMKFFGMRAGEFRKEWAELSEEDREQLKNGVADGSLTY